MDPNLYESLKEIVKKEIKAEIEFMRRSDQGCTEKCRAQNKMLEMNLERHEKVVQTLIEFPWCQDCSAAGESGANKAVCKAGCGRRLMKAQIPHMKSFGDKEQAIQTLKARVLAMEERDKIQNEYKQQKQQMKTLNAKLQEQKDQGALNDLLEDAM